jgi:hypothetical protein
MEVSRFGGHLLRYTREHSMGEIESWLVERFKLATV